MYLKVGNDIYLIENSYKDKSKKKDLVKDILATFSKGLNPVRDTNAYNKAKYRYNSVKDNFRKSMSDLVSNLEKGKINGNQFKYHARKEFKSAYYKAFELGTEATGLSLDYFKLPDGDYKWLDKIRSNEYKYLEKFIDDIVNDRGRMDYQDRMDMYIEKLDSVFDAGRVDAMPSNGTKIHWILGDSKEICPDCIEFASGSPYTQEELPSTPKAGDTRCLSNCNCWLRIDYETPAYVDLDIRKYSGNVEAIDWNSIDRLMSVMVEQSIIKCNYPDLYKERLYELNEDFNNLLDEVNINPYSRDFVLIHRLGSMIKTQRIENLKKGDINTEIERGRL